VSAVHIVLQDTIRTRHGLALAPLSTPCAEVSQALSRPPSSEPESLEPAFEEFLRAQRPALMGFLRSRGASEQDAQDVAQESLIRLMRYRDQPLDALRVLLFRIALNRLTDNHRRFASASGALHFSLDADLHELPSTEPGPEQKAEHLGELQRVRAAILDLPKRCRQIYLLNRIEGMSYSQIARHCGISVKAVEKHMSKALASLRHRFDAAPLSSNPDH